MYPRVDNIGHCILVRKEGTLKVLKIVEEGCFFSDPLDRCESDGNV